MGRLDHRSDAPPGPATPDAIVRGLTEVVVPDASPGPVLPFGPNAAPLLAAYDERGPLPVAAAIDGCGEKGTGRLVLVGHDGLIKPDALAFPDTRRFVDNARRWLAHGRPLPLHVAARPAAAKVLEGDATEPWFLPTEQPAVVVLNAGLLDDHPERIDWLRQALDAGWGVWIDSTPWGWAQVTGRDLRTEHGGNLLAIRYGACFGDGALSPPWVPAEDPLLHGEMALRSVTGRTSRQATLTLEALASALPTDERTFRPRLAAHADTRTAARLWWDDVCAGPDAPAACSIHPDATAFPGAVRCEPEPPVTVRLSPRARGWISTGVYAGPGERITIRIPAEATGRGWSVRIGCHADELWHLDQWRRFPAVSRCQPLSAELTTTANPFGGLVYIEVPDDGDDAASLSGPDTEVTIEGGVSAPLFILGSTAPAGWVSSLQRTGAPWGEIAGQRFVMSMPVDVLRSCRDPEGVARYWDAMLDHCADLAGIDRNRARPERYVIDRQISAGYMHAGYPVMMHDDVARVLVDADRLRSYDMNTCWGMFHETGHNHQEDAWTFDGTVEVTCNWFSLYCAERMHGRDPEKAHKELDRRTAKRRFKDYRRAGTPFEQWQEDPFLALGMYVELIDDYGWDTLKSVIASYHHDPIETDDDADRRDEFVLRYSRASGKDLRPFFTEWGVPTTARATYRGR